MEFVLIWQIGNTSSYVHKKGEKEPQEIKPKEQVELFSGDVLFLIENNYSYFILIEVPTANMKNWLLLKNDFLAAKLKQLQSEIQPMVFTSFSFTLKTRFRLKREILVIAMKILLFKRPNTRTRLQIFTPRSLKTTSSLCSKRTGFFNLKASNHWTRNFTQKTTP